MALKSVLKTIGLTGKLYTFRHAFIGNAMLKNTAAAVVKRWVGHTDQRVIDLYTRVYDKASQAAMQRLDEADSTLQVKKESQDGTEKRSAQIEHTHKDVKLE